MRSHHICARALQSKQSPRHTEPAWSLAMRSCTPTGDPNITYERTATRYSAWRSARCPSRLAAAHGNGIIGQRVSKTVRTHFRQERLITARDRPEHGEQLAAENSSTRSTACSANRSPSPTLAGAT